MFIPIWREFILVKVQSVYRITQVVWKSKEINQCSTDQ